MGTVTSRYGFPIDSDAWPTILGYVQARIGARVFVAPGDANGDGVVSVLDLAKVREIMLGREAPTLGADANLDGKVDVLDLVEVAHSLGRRPQPRGY